MYICTYVYHHIIPPFLQASSCGYLQHSSVHRWPISGGSWGILSSGHQVLGQSTLLLVCSTYLYVTMAILILAQYLSHIPPQVYYTTSHGYLGDPVVIHGQLGTVDFLKMDEENPDGDVITR